MSIALDNDALTRTSRSRRTVRDACAFVLVLAGAVATFEIAAGRRIEAARGESLVGSEVYAVVRAAQVPGPGVERIYLGDSVARQLFPAGQEPHDRVRFLAANAMISLAGNYYLLEDAFRACPTARDVVLLIRPDALQQNLDWPTMNHYFTDFFHTAAQIAEVWRVKHDRTVTIPQMARWLLPGTLATNSAWRQDPRGFAGSPFTYVPRSGTAPDVVSLSPIGVHFLQRMRTLVAARRGTLRIVPVPLPDNQPWRDPQRLFDDPITYVGREAFGDGVHLGPTGAGVRSCIGSDIARRFAEAHGLAADLPQTRLLPNDVCEDPGRPYSFLAVGR